MTAKLNRRTFSEAIATIGLTAVGLPALPAVASRKLRIGYTCITWGAFPCGSGASATLETAVRDISRLSFWGFETFPEILEDGTRAALLAGSSINTTCRSSRVIVAPT
jgi:hypothetical protein